MVQEEINKLFKNVNLNAFKELGQNPNVAKLLPALNFAKKVAPVVGAGSAVYNAKRSFDIADAMERINKDRPGSFGKKDIDYYRNKGKWVVGGSLAGTGIGGITGALSSYGIGTGAGAMIGTGIGGDITGFGYDLFNRYKPKQMTKADWIYIKDLNNNIQKKPKQEVKKEAKPEQNNNAPQQYYGPSSSIEDLIRKQQSVYGTYNTPETSYNIQQQNIDASIPEDVQSNTTGNNIDMGDVLDRYNNISDIRQGYLDKLQEFVDNYDTLNDANLDREMYLRGLAGWTGNPSWSSMADKMNPLKIEASKLELYKKLAEGQIQDEKELANIVSNIRMMEQMGIDPSIAMADSKAFNNITRLMVANKQAQTRMEIAQLNAKVKELDRQARIAIAQGKREDAYKLLQMRNQANAQIAAINSIGFGGDPASIYQAMSGFGYQVPNYTSSQDNDSNPYE